MDILGTRSSPGQDEVRAVGRGTRKCPACKGKSTIFLSDHVLSCQDVREGFARKLDLSRALKGF